MSKDKRILLVGAHPDDIEIGCAGTIIKNHMKASMDIRHAMVVFSLCEKDSGLDFTADEILCDMKNSVSMMGIQWEDVYIFEYPNTRLPDHTYDIRKNLEGIRDEYQPEVVYFHTEHDLHQDHVALAQACRRAFRGGEEIRCYEVYATLPEFKPNLYVDISAYIGKKIDVLNCYKTQKKRKYWNESLWTAKALLRGDEAHVKYAEAFEILRMIE